MLEEASIAQMLKDIVQQGFHVWDGFLSKGEVEYYRKVMFSEIEKGELKKAGVGKESDYLVNTKIRGDYIHWIENRDSKFIDYLEKWDLLSRELNRNLFLGIRDKELHMAYYPPGGSYARHLDNFNQGSNRILSTISYLNTDWKKEDGGELRLYLPSINPPSGFLDIEPVAGRMTCFLSDSIEHEVKTSKANRLSLTGWLLKDKILF
jgi:SM-20-related protein